jgi:MazG family protein
LTDNTIKSFSRLLTIMYKLRKECPWDRQQTAESLRQFILEETYEVLESIDGGKWDALADELGDLLLQIVFQSIIAEEENRFRMEDVINNINHKMIERHPHVFSNTVVDSASQVAQNWEHIKINSEKRNSLLAGVPGNAPALLRAQRLQEKASNVGFDWKNYNEVMTKIYEELDELKAAIEKSDKKNIEEELGDILFSIVNLSRFLGLVAEDSLRNANNKFTDRFTKIEAHYKNDYKQMKQAGLEELDKIWDKIKRV